LPPAADAPARGGSRRGAGEARAEAEALDPVVERALEDVAAAMLRDRV